MDKPRYTKNPIGSIKSLANRLSIKEEKLVRLANQADSFYYLHEREQKPDGSFREKHGVTGRLKTIQQRIQRRLYQEVLFPSYLHGSIKDVDSPRSHMSAAAVHQNARLLIQMDISNFYPSLSQEVVLDTWKRFFGFPPHVAQILTQLTIYQGYLPQGASTSPGLGNLAFWERESMLVSTLNDNNFTYSRYVDDIAISTKEYVEMRELAPIFSAVFGMFASRGVKPNRNKIEISTSGHPMTVHNLNVNGTDLTVPKEERIQTNDAVQECEDLAADIRLTEEYEQKWRRAVGRVLYMKELHLSEGGRYLARLEKVRPELSNKRLSDIEHSVSECERMAMESEGSMLKSKHRQVQKKIAALSQLHPGQMRPYLDRLRAIAPY